MATYTKQLLSSSSNGRAILVAATASPGTNIHTTGTSATTIDEIWLFAYNSSAGAVTLTLQFGGTTSPNDDVKISIPSQSGKTLVIAGEPLRGTGSAGVSVLAYAGTANVITVSGYVNRIA